MRGEYWIQGNYAQSADGDVDDYNHEGWALQAAVSEVVDAYRNADIEGVDIDPYEEYPDLEQIEREVMAAIGARAGDQILKDADISDATLSVAHGDPRIDGRLWAAKTQGWIRLAGNDAQMVGPLTKSKLSDLADGLYDAYGEDVENQEITIEVVNIRDDDTEMVGPFDYDLYNVPFLYIGTPQEVSKFKESWQEHEPGGKPHAQDKHGDWARGGKQTESPAFKTWFGDSKVVDRTGKPLVLYHGTRNGDLVVFDIEKRGEYTGAESAKKAFFFSDDPDVAWTYPDGLHEVGALNRATMPGAMGAPASLEYRLPQAERDYESALLSDYEVIKTDDGFEAKITERDQFGEEFTYTDGFVYDDRIEADTAGSDQIENLVKAAEDKIERFQKREETERIKYSQGSAIVPVHVRMTNPLVHDFGGGNYDVQPFTELINEAIEYGHDGVIMRRVNDAALGDIESTVYAVFEPKQIKSATANKGAFDPDNPDIRESYREHEPGDPPQPHPQSKHGDWARGGKQTESPAFKTWFGDSKVVDESGAPRVLYHGTQYTDEDIRVFDPQQEKVSSFGGPFNGLGTWLTSNPKQAEVYADLPEEDESGPIYPVYVSLQNPMILEGGSVEESKKAWDGLVTIWMDKASEVGDRDYMLSAWDKIKGRVKEPDDDAPQYKWDAYDNWHPDNPEVRDRIFANAFDLIREDGITALAVRAKFQSSGYDGIILRDSFVDTQGGDEPREPHDIVITFTDTQIKSATANKGAWDADNPDITESYREHEPGGKPHPQSKHGDWARGGGAGDSDKATAYQRFDELSVSGASVKELTDARRTLMSAIKDSDDPDDRATYLDLAKEEYEQQGVKAQPFKEWFGDWEKGEGSRAVDENGHPVTNASYSAAVDENGEPMMVYHGTTHEFDSFNMSRGNVENNLGKGHYFTSDTGDARKNYAGHGPDLTIRITQEGERITDNVVSAMEEIEQRIADGEKAAEFSHEVSAKYGLDDNEDMRGVLSSFASRHETQIEKRQGIPVPETLATTRRYVHSEDLARELASERLAGESEKMIKAYINIRNPVVLGDPKWGKKTRQPETDETVFTISEEQTDYEGRTPDDENFDWETAEYTGQVSGNGVKLYESMNRVAADYHDVDVGKIWEDISDDMQEYNYGGLNAGQLVSRIKSSEGGAYLTDDDGNLASGDFIAAAFRDMGFDGVKYLDASRHFKNMGLGSGTQHFIVWDGKKIKSVGNRGTFDDSDKFREHEPGGKPHAQDKHGNWATGGSVRAAVDAAKVSAPGGVFEVAAKKLGITERELVKRYASEMADEAVGILLRPGGWDDPRLDEIGLDIKDFFNKDFQQSQMKIAVSKLPDDLSSIDEQSLFSLLTTINNETTGAPYEEYKAQKSISAELEKRAEAKEVARVAGQRVARGKVQAGSSKVTAMKRDFEDKHRYSDNETSLGDNLKFHRAFLNTAKENLRVGGGGVSKITIMKDGGIEVSGVDRGKIKAGISRDLGGIFAKNISETELAQVNGDIHEWRVGMRLAANFQGLPEVGGPRANEREAVKFSQNIVNSWAASSTGTNAVSLATQMAISEKFGTDPIIEAASDEGVTDARKLYDKNKKAFDSAINSIYEKTQKTLKDSGVREVILWRGTNFKKDPDGLDWLDRNDAVTVRPVLDMNPVSSFAMDYESAARFSSGDSSRVQMMTAAKVPAENIFSMASTGLGAVTESEVLVIGRKLDNRISVAGKNIGLARKTVAEFWETATENAAAN